MSDNEREASATKPEPAETSNEVSENLWIARHGADQSVTMGRQDALEPTKFHRVFLLREDIPAVIARLQREYAAMCEDLASRKFLDGPHRSRGGGASSYWEYTYRVADAHGERILRGSGTTSAAAKAEAKRHLDRWLGETATPVPSMPPGATSPPWFDLGDVVSVLVGPSDNAVRIAECQVCEIPFDRSDPESEYTLRLSDGSEVNAKPSALSRVSRPTGGWVTAKIVRAAD